MDNIYTNSQAEIVEYGLDKIDADETIEVNLKDLLYVYRTLQEYMRFFHQPSHYPELSDIYEFLGTADNTAGFHILNEAVYKKCEICFLSELTKCLVKVILSALNCQAITTRISEI